MKFKSIAIKTVAITKLRGRFEVKHKEFYLLKHLFVIPPPKAVKNADIKTPKISSLQ